MLNVICALLSKELKTRFGADRYLGYIWVVGEPLGIVLVITTIVTIIRGYHHQVIPDGISIFMFLISGTVPYFMFRSIATQFMNGISANLGLFAYEPVKPIHVFIARTMLEFYIYFVIFFCILFIAGWFLRFGVLPVYLLNVMFCVLLLMFSGFVLGLCLAVLSHFFEILKTLLMYFGIVFYWSSGVIFSTWLIPKPLLDIFYYNPLLHIMELLKYNFFDSYPLQDDYSYTYPIICIMFLLLVGSFFYHHNRQALTAARKQ